jgi:O-antigen/teichoic acid export membrane protein
MINMGVGFAGYFVNTIMGFVCRMVFVRCLATEYLGISGLFSNVLSMLSLAELGIGTAIIYALYKPLAENDEEKIASLMKFYGTAYKVIGCVIAVIGLALLPVLNILIGDTPDIKENIYVIYIVYLFNTCLTYFFSYRASLLTAAQRNYVQLALSYIITTAQSVVQIVALLTTHEYMLYLGIQTIGTIAFNILVSRKTVKDYPYIARKNIQTLAKEEKRSLFKNVKALTVNKLAEKLVDSTDNIIITYFSGLITVGAASNYTLLSGTLSTLTNQIFNSMVASFGNLNAVEDKETSFRFYKILQLANFIIFGWASIGICFVSSDLVELFFGDNYVLSPGIPFVLALNFYLVTMQSAITTYRSTLGLFKYGQFTLIFTSAFNLIFSIILGKIWGLFGIYIATAFARLLTNTWYMPYAVFKHGFNRNPLEYFVLYFKYLIVIAIDAGICFLVFNYINFNPVLNVVIKILVCSIVPNVTVVLFWGRTDEFKYIKKKIMSLFNNIKNRLQHD